MASKTPRNRDNVVALAALRQARDVDPEELLGFAEYLSPVGATGDAGTEPTAAEIEAIVDWADADAQILRQAWMVAVNRYGVHNVNGGAIDLLASALHRAEARAPVSNRAPRVRAPASRPRPRVAARRRAHSTIELVRRS
jgi:hypothetical protein